MPVALRLRLLPRGSAGLPQALCFPFPHFLRGWVRPRLQRCGTTTFPTVRLVWQPTPLVGSVVGLCTPPFCLYSRDNLPEQTTRQPRHLHNILNRALLASSFRQIP